MNKQFLEECLELNKNLYNRWKELRQTNGNPIQYEEYLSIWKKYYDMINSLIEIVDFNTIHPIITHARRNNLTVDYIIKTLREKLGIEVIE